MFLTIAKIVYSACMDECVLYKEKKTDKKLLAVGTMKEIWPSGELWPSST